jgi:hypothetical protein
LLYVLQAQDFLKVPGGISVYGVLVYGVGFVAYSIPVTVCAVVVVPVVAAFGKV